MIPSKAHMQLATEREREVERQILAHDALSKLSEQFASRPDFGLLIDALVLTITGQFAVGGAFASIRNPGTATCDKLSSATGRFRDNQFLATCGDVWNKSQRPDRDPGPCRVEDLHALCSSSHFVASLQEAGVRIVAPLRNGPEVIGLVGLGEKVSRRVFDEAEVSFLGTLANTIAPLIANSMLFMEITSLNEWHYRLINSVRQGVFVFDHHNSLMKVNSAGVDILKALDPEIPDAVGLAGTFLEKVFPEDMFPGWAYFVQGARKDANNNSLENLSARGPQGVRVFNVRVTGLSHEDDADSDIVVTLDDITELKENEDRLFDLSRLADKGLMASSIAHELNNFLALILGGIEISQLSLERKDTARTRTVLEKLKENVGMMERFTAGLMDYTKLETQKRSTNLNDVITDVLSFVSTQRRFQRISIRTTLDPNLPMCNIDPDQISQLLLNFLNNAADAIQITKREDGEIRVSTERKGGRTSFLVADNGCGIDPAVKNKMFKGHVTTKADGHGYGLVTCYRIIENHKAAVDIDSIPGSGSVIAIRFPSEPDEKGS